MRSEQRLRHEFHRIMDSADGSIGRTHNHCVLNPMKSGHSLRADAFERRGRSWFASAGIPSDLIMDIGDYTFHLHKFAMVAKCGRLSRLMYEAAERAERISIDDAPGGAEALELAAKFCYGIPIELKAANIAGLRCCAEYLDMSEDVEEGNLIFKTEAFLSYVVLSSWRDSIVVLKSCEALSPWAENLQIVRRCSESIAWKACSSPGLAAAKARNSRTSSPSQSPRGSASSLDWWFQDVAVLRIDHFVRVITAIKVKGMRFDLIGSAITFYASHCLPGFSDAGGGGPAEYSSSTCTRQHQHQHEYKGGLHIVVASSTIADRLSPAQAEGQRAIVESLISILPQHKDAVCCTFLLRMLRIAMKLRVSQALVNEVEKRAGVQLDQATLADVLIPCYYDDDESSVVTAAVAAAAAAAAADCTYDVELMQRLVEHFLMHQHVKDTTSGPGAGAGGSGTPAETMTRVARLVDSYLTEIARERTLPQSKFQLLAEALPESARSCDDGLYRAVDCFLKAHPTLAEHERKRLCKLMDCQKLSLEACMHAAQNERLPLRTVVQVLFSEQVKIANALATGADSGGAGVSGGSRARRLLDSLPQSFQEEWLAARRDIKALKLDNDSLRAKVLQLQGEVDALSEALHKGKLSSHPQAAAARAATGGWSSGWKKISKLTAGSFFHGVGGKPSGTVFAAHNPAASPQHHCQEQKTRRWRNSIS